MGTRGFRVVARVSREVVHRPRAALPQTGELESWVFSGKRGEEVEDDWDFLQ